MTFQDAVFPRKCRPAECIMLEQHHVFVVSWVCVANVVVKFECPD